jgi:hypothetical protein
MNLTSILKKDIIDKSLVDISNASRRNFPPSNPTHGSQKHMKNFALRGISPQLDDHLKSLAEQENQSVNQCILSILEERFGLAKEHRFMDTHSDLDFSMGRWTPEEAASMETALSDFGQVDETFWSS